ncbi:MAG: SulP family inorganic anion transporter [Dehalococcoidia bacterium]|nr:SulP family inorganic anion transporter [Dehalococcoidia bacterium]
MTSESETRLPADDEPEEALDEVDQPGAGSLRAAVEEYAQREFQRGRLPSDAIAGLNSAVASVPDGMASGLLAGVNPIYGLYACIAGPIVGGLLSSSQLMVIATTSGLSLTAGQALEHLTIEDRTDALFALVILAGVIQVALGLFRVGALTRFVSFSVMTGFIIGIGVLTILTQIPTLTGYAPENGSRVGQAFETLTHISEVDPVTVGVSVAAFVLVVILPRFLGSVGTLLGVVLPSVVVWAFFDGVEVVGDVGEIPSGLPMPALPPVAAIDPAVISGAIAVAIIGIVQGAGVSQSVPNPDGKRRNVSRDILAQGFANVASGGFHGIPVGGSIKTTALTVLSGARSRWATVFAGVWMAILVLAAPNLLVQVAMPALAALLVYASLSLVRVREARSLWMTGWPSRLASVTTFLTTLVLPIQAAVGIGVVLSALVSMYAASADISVVQLIRHPDGNVEERVPPGDLPSDEVTVLDVYGHLFFAAARTLERRLPGPDSAHHPVVVLRLRGRTKVGATLIEVLTNYADRLREVDGRLYLSGLSNEAYDQIVRTKKLRLTGPVRAYEATPVRGESTQEAAADARTWLVRVLEDEQGDETPEQT